MKSAGIGPAAAKETTGMSYNLNLHIGLNVESANPEDQKSILLDALKRTAAALEEGFEEVFQEELDGFIDRPS